MSLSLTHPRTAYILRENETSHHKEGDQLHMDIDTLRATLSIKAGPPEKIVVVGETAEDVEAEGESVAEDHRFKYMNVSVEQLA